MKPESMRRSALLTGAITAGFLLLSGMTAVAYFYSHAPRGFFPILNAGELAALYCFVFLYLAAAGAGPWSVDRFIGKKSD